MIHAGDGEMLVESCCHQVDLASCPASYTNLHTTKQSSTVATVIEPEPHLLLLGNTDADR